MTIKICHDYFHKNKYEIKYLFLFLRSIQIIYENSFKFIYFYNFKVRLIQMTRLYFTFLKKLLPLHIYFYTYN